MKLTFDIIMRELLIVAYSEYITYTEMYHSYDATTYARKLRTRIIQSNILSVIEFNICEVVNMIDILDFYKAKLNDSRVLPDCKLDVIRRQIDDRVRMCNKLTQTLRHMIEPRE